MSVQPSSQQQLADFSAEENLRNFFALIANKIKELVEEKDTQLRYGYILAKHYDVMCRRLKVANPKLQFKNKKSQIQLLRENLKSELSKDFTSKKINSLRDELNQAEQLLGENFDQKIYEKNFSQVYEKVAQVHSEIGFQLDPNSAFTKTAYSELPTIYKAVAKAEIAGKEAAKAADLIADLMVNQALPEETGSKAKASSNSDTLLKSQSLATYIEKLETLKKEEYRLIEFTLSDITKKAEASYNKDLKDSVVNLLVPDSSVIDQFFSTSIRTRGKEAVDLDLHKLLVLIMESDTDEGDAYDLLDKLQAKYFSKSLEEISAKEAEENIRNFLNELIASLRDILSAQMKEGNNKHKPKLAYMLNTLMRKYHSYYLSKKPVKDEEGHSTYSLEIRKNIPVAEYKVYKAKKLIPRLGLAALITDILLGIGAGGIVMASALLFPISIPFLFVVALATFFGIFTTRVNFRIYHRFFKPFLIRAVTKGLFDALFGEEAPLNSLYLFYKNLSGFKKALFILGSVFILGPLLFGGVIGFSVTVSIATMVYTMLSAIPFIAGAPLLMVGAAIISSAILVLTFIVHIPLVLVVTYDLLVCIKETAVIAFNVIKGEKNDSFFGRVVRAAIVIPLLIGVALLTLPLVVATFLTVKSFKDVITAFAGVIRTALNAPMKTTLAVCGAIAAFPGVLIISIAGLFEAGKRGLKFLDKKLFSKSTKSTKTAAEHVKQMVEASPEKPANKRKNPWISKFHHRRKKFKMAFGIGELAINGTGNGLVAGDSASSRGARIAGVGIAGFASFCNGLLSYFNENEAKIGEKGTIKVMTNTYSQLEQALPPASVDEGESLDAPSAEEGKGEIRAETAQSTTSRRSHFSRRVAHSCFEFFETAKQPQQNLAVDINSTDIPLPVMPGDALGQSHLNFRHLAD